MLGSGNTNECVSQEMHFLVEHCTDLTQGKDFLAEDMMMGVREKGEQRHKSSVETRSRTGRPRISLPAAWQALQLPRDYSFTEKLLKKFRQDPYTSGNLNKTNKTENINLLSIKTFRNC